MSITKSVKMPLSFMFVSNIMRSSTKLPVLLKNTMSSPEVEAIVYHKNQNCSKKFKINWPPLKGKKKAETVG